MPQPDENGKWIFHGHCRDGDKLEIDGLNVWDFEWRKSAKATVRDPLYGQVLEFDVYEIATRTRTLRFAAGEFSNNVWGFFVPVKR